MGVLAHQQQQVESQLASQQQLVESQLSGPAMAGK